MKKLLFLICIASLISCESDIILPETDTTPMSSNKRSLGEAIDIATRSLSLIEGQGSRSGGRTIDMDNIAYVCDRSTRAADNDAFGLQMVTALSKPYAENTQAKIGGQHGI